MGRECQSRVDEAETGAGGAGQWRPPSAVAAPCSSSAGVGARRRLWDVTLDVLQNLPAHAVQIPTSVAASSCIVVDVLVGHLRSRDPEAERRPVLGRVLVLRDRVVELHRLATGGEVICARPCIALFTIKKR